jgi:hydroxyacylglutathione hydrolase
VLFRQVLHERASCASYIVGCPSHGVAAVIDAQPPVEQYLEVTHRHGLEVTDVMDTHVHADHLSASRALAEATGARLHLGAAAGVSFQFSPLRDADEISVGNRGINVIHTPGHTPEHVSLVVDDWFVLTGDTLFVGDVGRVDLALEAIDDGELQRRARILHASLQRLLQLRDDIEVFPGHYSGSTCGREMDGKPMSTIGRERRVNQRLALDEDEFVSFQIKNLPPMPHGFEEIKTTNLVG